MKKLNLTFGVMEGGRGRDRTDTYLHHLKNSQVRKIPLQVINVTYNNSIKCYQVICVNRLVSLAEVELAVG